MITITGATGQLGTGIIEQLIAKGYHPSNITALARSKEKAQPLIAKGVNIKYGNYDDYASLVNAFKGSDKVLLISGNEMEKRVAQQINAVNAAREANVKHILYTSIQRKTDSDSSPINFVVDSHVATENAIKESGLSYTLLRNNLYMDMLPWVLGEKVLETGIFYPAKDGKIAYAVKSDIAEATANILIKDGFENKEYNISNSHSMSFQEVANHLSEISGKEVAYTSPDVASYKSILVNAGVPAFAADMLAGFAEGANAGELEAGNSDLPVLLGREPIGYKQFLNGLFYAQDN